MSAVLFKHSTPLARSAAFLPPDEPLARIAEQAAPLPTEHERAIASLTATNAALRDELVALRTTWNDELSAAQQRAHQLAAEQHRRDDDRRFAALAAELGHVRQQLGQTLLAAVEPSARELAAVALGRLVAVREGDVDWIARIVERRLAALDQASVICLQVAPSDLEGEISAIVPQGTVLESDASLQPGMVRLKLRLGAVMLDPVAGLARLLQMLREGQADG